MKTKILELFGEPISNGGQESFVMNCIEVIQSDDIIIDLATPYYCDNEYYADVVHKKGGYIYCFGLPFEPGKSRFNIVDKLKELLKNNLYDIVHIHSGSISVLALAAYVAYKKGVNKIIVHSHSSGDKQSIKHYIIKKLSAPIFYKCATDYCACSKLAAEWKFPKKIVNKNTVVLKNGINTKLFKYNSNKRSEYRSKLGIDEQTFVIGHVGRFSFEKNQKFLVNVFCEIKERMQECKLVLIGAGEDLEAIKDLVVQRGIQDKVLFEGNVNNVNDYMQAFDVFALPSLFEGLGTVGIEAQGAGLPVVASDRVPADMQLTNAVSFLSLESSYVEWANCICGYKGYERKDTSDEIRKKGFDICNTVIELQCLYGVE